MADETDTRREGSQLRESSPSTDSNNAVEWTDNGSGSPVLSTIGRKHVRLSINNTDGTTINWTLEGRDDRDTDTSAYTQIASGSVSGSGEVEGAFDGLVEFDHVIVTTDDTAGDFYLSRTVGSTADALASDGGDELLTLPHDLSDVDDSFSTTTSWQTGAAIELASPRMLKEVMPYFRDTGGGGSDHEWRLLVAKDTSLAEADAPTGSLSDGDGWLIVDDDGGSTIASGGDGPDISGPGYEVFGHLLVFQLQATSSGSTGRAQLTATEGV